MLIWPTAQWPPKEPLVLLDGKIVDAGVTNLREP
jgi:hypothetical protein